MSRQLTTPDRVVWRNGARLCLYRSTSGRKQLQSARRACTFKASCATLCNTGDSMTRTETSARKSARGRSIHRRIRMRRLLMQRFAFDESSVKRKSRTLKTSAATRAKRYLRLSGDDYLQELGAKSETTLDDLAQRQRLLLPAALIGLVATAVVWIFALAFPNLISRVYQFITDSSVPRYGTLLSVLAMAIPFMPPFVSAFALLSM